MAYYGAQVIHPKTIKPLYLKQIPLYVKSFLNKDLPGTVIREDIDVKQLPPIIVLKKNQVLLTITSRDFSFITEDRISDIYELFHKHKIKINLMQNAAISFSCCIDNSSEKIELLMKALHNDFKVAYFEGLELLTVRYNKDGLLEELSKDRTVLLEQRSPVTIQRLLK
jgi:aspartate kinase